MASLLLSVIYLAFVSLGLPDALLGSAWPVMQGALNAPLSFAGAVSMVISGGTILSSLLSDRMTRKLGAGLVTALSVLMTAAALLGFSLCSAPWMLILWAVPYGLGAGAVDAALNNYVALHYSSRHMSWLHCMWGVGASISPFIMSLALQRGWGWQMGYRSVSYIQLALTALLFLSLPLWKKRTNETAESNESVEPAKRQSIGQLLRLPGVPLILLTFFGYCAMESTAGLWASSYLVNARGVEVETAARLPVLSGHHGGPVPERLYCGSLRRQRHDPRRAGAGGGQHSDHPAAVAELPPHRPCDAGRGQRADLSLHHSFHARVLWP